MWILSVELLGESFYSSRMKMINDFKKDFLFSFFVAFFKKIMIMIA